MEFKHGDVVVAQFRGTSCFDSIVIYPEKEQSLVLIYGPWVQGEKERANLRWLANWRLDATFSMNDDVECAECKTAIKRKDFVYKIFNPTKDDGKGDIIGYCDKCSVKYLDN